ncbi:hypothetical protein DGG96_09385 [Legionella qingyii]|uniref:Uncharacterized protein n=1 Tax=Legionella qingyii TaxID=2184757 RepID=A0A317U533_9GAMM|nr:hypothetical protein DGG96_09385 [Legionella qingyii]
MKVNGRVLFGMILGKLGVIISFLDDRIMRFGFRYGDFWGRFVSRSSYFCVTPVRVSIMPYVAEQLLVRLIYGQGFAMVVYCIGFVDDGFNLIPQVVLIFY